MGIWEYVQKHDFSSPENQIKLLVKETQKLSPKDKRLKILDIGGGLINRKESLQSLGLVTVLDIKKGPGVKVVADAHQLPFPHKSFDMVTLFMVLEHLQEPRIALDQISRVLKPKGILLLTTVQYWHKHHYPNDYYRYTDAGLEYLCEKSGLGIKKIWSHGGPFLVIFHAIELNLPKLPRKFFLLFVPIFNWLDDFFFKHQDKRKLSDSLGWSLLAQK